MSILRESYRFVFDQASFARYQSYQYRHNYWHLVKNMSRSNLRKRREVLRGINGRLDIPYKLGYAVHSNDDFENTEEVISEVLSIVRGKGIDEFGNSSESVPKKNDFLIPLLTPEELKRDSEIVKLATSDKILASVGGYFGFLPILTYINVWFSPNKMEDLDGSQFFHLDHEDFSQLKVLMFIDDVDEGSGPMNVISAESSLKIQKKFDYRMTNEKKSMPDSAFDESKVKMMTGGRGDVLFVDTSRCFHMGSRKGKKPRILLAMQYLTPMAFTKRTLRSRLLTDLQLDSTEKEKLLFNF